MLPLALLLAVKTYFCVDRPLLLRKRSYMRAGSRFQQSLKYQLTELLMLRPFLCSMRDLKV